MEEGDLSYWFEEVLYNRNFLSKRQKKEKLKYPAKKQLFSDDYLFALTTQSNCFPVIDNSKKITINNFEHVERFYSPKLWSSNNVGILPAAHRFHDTDLNTILNFYKNYLNPGDFLKLHPSFEQYPKLISKIKSINLKLNNYFELVGNDVILEAELPKKPLNLFGPYSSLERYANAFGGSFTQIKELTTLQEGRS